VLGYYCLFIIFEKVHFTVVIMPIFLGLTGTNFIGVIYLFLFFGKMVEYSFAESCLLAVLSAGSDNGQTRVVLPLWQK
jgi:hypothetical protein